MEDKNLGQATSIWMATTPSTNYPSLNQNIKIDVVIVGGGMAGLMAAYFLKIAGLKVAVIEAGRIASATTGYTTAKITSLHGHIYSYLIKHFGQDLAQIYADANQTAVNQVEKIVNELKIECDFDRISTYTYSNSTDYDP